MLKWAKYLIIYIYIYRLGGRLDVPEKRIKYGLNQKTSEWGGGLRDKQ